MKFLLPILLFSLSVSSQTVALSFSPLAVSTANVRLGSGTTFWQGTRSVSSIPSNIHYFRANWPQVQTAHSTFNWAIFDAQINAAIDLNDGSQVVLRVVGIDEGYTGNDIAGSRCSYPAFLHTLMQTETVKDWVYGGNNQWVANYNSTHWIGEIDNMFLAFNTHLDNTSHNGVPYRSVIYGIDIMGFGDYFEWHNFGSGWNGSSWAGPAGTQATDATQIALIQSNLSRFPNYQLFGNISMVYGDETGNSVGAFAFNASNSVGPIGFRSDHTGDAGTFSFEQIKMNSRVVSGVNFKTAWLNQWKIAPMTGEIIQPGSGSTNGGANCHGYNLQNEILTYHYAFFSNVNINSGNACEVANLTAAANSSGYAIRPQSGTMSDSIRPLSNLLINLSLINEGITPTYQPWNLTFELRQAGVIKFSFTSTFSLKMFLPGVANITNTFPLGSTFSGTYDLYMVAYDPNGYRKPLPFQITGRGADGAYLLRSGIHVAVTGTPPPPPPPPPPNNPPSIFAGGDFTDSLSIRNFDTLKGIVNDANGDAVSYTWTQNSGPNTATMGTASGTALTTEGAIPVQNIISGLVAGSYSFRLTGNDGHGGITSDDVIVTVINVTAPPPPPPPPPVYNPPVINAGADTIIFLPHDSAYLHGTVTSSDTTILSYKWVEFSGPVPLPTINSSTAIATKVSGLLIGTYQFKLTVTDNAGNIVVDYIQVFVLPVVIPPPIPLPHAPDKEKVGVLRAF